MRLQTHRNSRLSLRFLAGLLVLLGVGSAQAERTMDTIPGAPAAVDFVLADPSGTEHRLSDYRDQIVLVNFWATWCKPCRDEMPALENLYQEWGPEGLEILAVHVGPGGAPMEQFLTEVPVSFPVLIDAQMGLRNWGVLALPTTVLVSRDGRRLYRAVGHRDWDSDALKAFLQQVSDEG